MINIAKTLILICNDTNLSTHLYNLRRLWTATVEKDRRMIRDEIRFLSSKALICFWKEAIVSHDLTYLAIDSELLSRLDNILLSFFEQTVVENNHATPEIFRC